jgi:hypothetical protein
MHDTCSPSHHCTHLASKQHGDCRGAVTHHHTVDVLDVDASASTGADCCSEKSISPAFMQTRRCECFRLHDCIHEAVRFMHNRNAAAAWRKAANTRCHVAGLFYAVLRRKPRLADPPLAPTNARAAVKAICRDSNTIPTLALLQTAWYLITMSASEVFLCSCHTSDQPDHMHASRSRPTSPAHMM